MKRFLVLVVVFLRWLWRFLTTGLNLASNLVFLLMVAFLLVVLLYRPQIHVPKGAALVLRPRGDIVERRSTMDPVARILNHLGQVPMREQVLLQDLLDVIAHAARDPRIKMLVLRPSQLGRAGLNQLRDIGHALEQFKKSGKVIVCEGDSFTQAQYYLASWADKIYLNPMGSVDLHGFGLFRLYMQKLLERLGVNVHVYRVGTYKSALEPFVRSEMSTAARQANGLWLGHLWQAFCHDIAANRGMPPAAIQQYIDHLADNLESAGGDGAQLALQNGFIDGVKSRQQIRDYLVSLVGRSSDGENFKQIDAQDYLRIMPRSWSQGNDNRDGIGILVAEGTIIYGQSGVGFIGSETLCRQIRQAREDKHIKAIVLRIDSGGGSAFASELIRQELLLTKNAGKPVVVSMGSMAASGAYWLAANASRILASPLTLTGSIGIFGAVPTFEHGLAKVGVFSDGVGTTRLAGAGNPTRAMPPELDRAMQLKVEHGYHRFVAIVSQGRKLPLKQVEDLAQGRVWDGATAFKLGLVDQLGTLADAVADAARLTGLRPEDGRYLERSASSLESFLERFAEKGWLPPLLRPGQAVFRSVVEAAAGPEALFIHHPDPGHLYSYCGLQAKYF